VFVVLCLSSVFVSGLGRGLAPALAACCLPLTLASSGASAGAMPLPCRRTDLAASICLPWPSVLPHGCILCVLGSVQLVHV